MILLKKQVAAKLLVGVAVVGVAFSPVMASAATDTTEVTATVNSVISVASAATVGMTVTPTSGGAEATASDAVTVDSNDADGYTLKLENDTTLTMAGFKQDGTTSNGATLAATGGTVAVPAALSANSWGFRVDGLGGFGVAGTTTYAPVTDAGDIIRDTATTANAEATTVKYAVKVDLSKPSGIYKDTVTYTATVK